LFFAAISATPDNIARALIPSIIIFTRQLKKGRFTYANEGENKLTRRGKESGKWRGIERFS